MIHTAEYMSKPVITAAPDATVTELTKRMDARNIGSIVIVHKKELSGIVTERDIVRKVLAKGKDPEKTTAADIMTHEVYTVARDATLMEVAALMKQHIMRRIVVVDKEGAPLGIITSRDLIALFV